MQDVDVPPLIDEIVLDTIVSLSRGRENFYSSYLITKRVRKQWLNITSEEVEDSLIYLEYCGKVVGCGYCGESFAPTLAGRLYLRRN